MKCLLVSPSVASAHTAFNGNAHTAQRWAQMLRALGNQVTVCASASELSVSQMSQHDALLALHARRSASAILRWREAQPAKPLVLVLTGTDVYRDIHEDSQAQAALDAASHLVVLQAEALLELASAHRAKARVIVQSAQSVPKSPRTDKRFRVLAVGHLREEKDPATYLRAAALCADHEQIVWHHIGQSLDAALLQQALDTQHSVATYSYLGAQSHAQTLQAIADADLLVHTSRIEGGAHVIAEAVACGTPVLASRISGNLGMLGPDYGGYFSLGEAGELASKVAQISKQPHMLSELAQQCAAIAPRFLPTAEQANLQTLFADLATFQRKP